MNFKTIIALFGLFVMPNLKAQECFQIDFSDFENSNPVNCIYEISGIKMELFTRHMSTQLCNPPSTNSSIHDAKIKKEDLHVCGNSQLGMSFISGGCLDQLMFKIYYENGSVLEKDSTTIIIDSLENVDYIVITEIECGLYYSNGSFDPVIVSFFQPSPTSKKEEIVLESKITAYPNPGSNCLNITSDTHNTRSVKLKFINACGAIVFMDNECPINNSEQYSLDVYNYPSGVYTLLIQGEGWLDRKTIVIAH